MCFDWQGQGVYLTASLNKDRTSVFEQLTCRTIWTIIKCWIYFSGQCTDAAQKVKNHLFPDDQRRWAPSSARGLPFQRTSYDPFERLAWFWNINVVFTLNVTLKCWFKTLAHEFHIWTDARVIPESKTISIKLRWRPSGPPPVSCNYFRQISERYSCDTEATSKDKAQAQGSLVCDIPLRG